MNDTVSLLHRRADVWNCAYMRSLGAMSQVCCLVGMWLNEIE